MYDRFETFATTIASINRSVQKIKSQEMKALGLKGTHAMCLYSLGKHPDGLTATQLCRLCGEDKAAISRTISELTEKEYIITDSPANKRVYRAKIFLTEKGRRSFSYISRRIDHVLDIVGAGLTPRQRNDFYRSLSLIAGNLKLYMDMEDIK